MSPDAWTFAIGKSEVSVPIRSRLVVNTAEAAIDAAIAGIGITRVLSYQIAAAVRAGARNRAPGVRAAAVARPPRLHRRPAVAAEIACLPRFAVPRLRAQLAESAG